ncbi:DDE-1 domain-containing protein [Aphis craccivora]|uniref:DDE-1 domain-containing protein n=1 Tax=Aphis craccivora TaxID=307492 RepID=A0A6G0VZK1_APHCR|nr:DDE-1 domain-containing protein [Aphis craccivora]
METAVKNNVTILLLPPHTSHLFQPMNLAVFKLVKSTWDQRLCNWSRHHQGQKLLKSELSKLVCEIWADIDIQIIKNGFRKAGIHPHNKFVIERERFDPLSLSRWDNFWFLIGTCPKSMEKVTVIIWNKQTHNHPKNSPTSNLLHFL